MLLYAFLLVQAAQSKEELDNWVDKVLAQAPRHAFLGESWTPPDEPAWQGKGTQLAPVFQYMKAALHPQGMNNAWYSNIGEAIAACKLDGCIDGLQYSERVKSYLNVKEEWQGPRDSKYRSKARWRGAIFDVAGGPRVRRGGWRAVAGAVAFQVESAAVVWLAI